MYKVMIIDDDAELYALIAEFFAETEFRSEHAADGASGLARVSAAPETWDAVVLDVMLPDLDGMEVLQRMRRQTATRDLPILMLTALGGENDKISGLEAGADDYMAKPFSLRELSARLNALLRRSGRHVQEAAPNGNFLRLDDLAVDRAALQLERGGQKVNLTPIELRLLERLMESPGQTVSRGLLYSHVFGHAAYGPDRSLDMAVSRLRKKLGPRPDGGTRIRAAWGEGYIFLASEKRP